MGKRQTRTPLNGTHGLSENPRCVADTFQTNDRQPGEQCSCSLDRHAAGCARHRSAGLRHLLFFQLECVQLAMTSATLAVSGGTSRKQHPLAARWDRQLWP